MKIFNWMHRRLHCINNYCQVSQNKDHGFEEDAEVKSEAAVEMDTNALLLHDMLNGILSIGTLGRHHQLVSQPYSDPEQFFEEDGDEEVEEAAFFAVAREPPAATVVESFEIKLSVEDEKRIMEVVQVHEVEGSDKILELPLLHEDKERRKPPRTTLADLLAANAFNDLNDSRKQQQQRRAISSVKKMQHKKSEGAKKPPAVTTTTATRKLQTLISSMMKKRIHPETVPREGNTAEKPTMAERLASDVF